MDLKEKIRNINDFPKPGIVFRDITPLLLDPKAFEYLIFRLKEEFKFKNIDLIAGIESRGFIIGAALANVLGKGFIPIRKAGKLPADTIKESFEKEYGTDTLEMHKDAVRPGQHVLVVDDLLATGGTALASAKLVERLGGKPSFCFVIELSELGGAERLRNYDVFSLLRY